MAEEIKVKFQYEKIRKKLSAIPKTLYDLRDDFLQLYNMNYTFSYGGKVISNFNVEDFSKIIDHIKSQDRPVIYVTKKSDENFSGEVESEEEGDEEPPENLDPSEGGWTMIGVPRQKSEGFKKTRRQIEEEKKIKDSFERIVKDINVVEKQKEGEMTFKNLAKILYTLILPAEQELNNIKNNQLLDQTQISNTEKKITEYKNKYENLIKAKEEEHSKLVADHLLQIEQQKLQAKETTDIQKNYEELQKSYKEAYNKLIGEKNNLKKELEKEKLINARIEEIENENLQLKNELEEKTKLNEHIFNLENELKPMLEDLNQMKGKINDAATNYKTEKEQIEINIEKLNIYEEEKLKGMENDLKKEKEEKEELKKNNEKFSKENKELSENIKTKDETIAKLNNEIQELKKEKEKYSNKANEDLNKLNKKINDLQGDLNSKDKEIAEKNKTFENNKQAQENIIGDNVKKINILEKEKNELQTNYTNILKEKEKLDEDYKKLKKEKEDLIIIHEQKMKEKDEKNMKIIKNLDNMYKKHIQESFTNYEQKSKTEILNIKNTLISE